jgi:hypothetical protein
MLVAQGRSNKEIVRQLAISSATVKNHMHSILQKLRVSRRGQAVARLRGVATIDSSAVLFSILYGSNWFELWIIFPRSIDGFI